VVAAIAILSAKFYELMILIFIVLIHEMGHAFAASFFSWRIKQVLLLPFGGVLEVEEYGNKPIKEELIVTLAGPIQHGWLLLAGLFFHQMNLLSDDLYTTFVEFNIMILIFNCLPILPLDGGKLILLLFSKILPFQQAMQRAIIVSFVFLMIYMCALLIISPYHLNGWIIVIFLLFSLYNEWKNRPFVFIRYLIDKYTRQSKLGQMKKINVMSYNSLSEVVEKFHRGVSHTIIVKDSNEKKHIPEAELLKSYFENNPMQVKIRDLLF